MRRTAAISAEYQQAGTPRSSQTFRIPKYELADAHAPTILTDPFEPEHPGEAALADRNQETTIVSVVVRFDAINLLDQRFFNIALERILHLGWRECSVHRDEKGAHRFMVPGCVGAKVGQLFRSLGLMTT